MSDVHRVKTGVMQTQSHAGNLRQGKKSEQDLEMPTIAWNRMHKDGLNLLRVIHGNFHLANLKKEN